VMTEPEPIEIIIPQTGEVIPFTRSNLARGQATRRSLNLPDGLAFEEWASIGDALCNAEQSIMWWVGDWWAYGASQGYGERSKMLEELRSRGHNPPSFRTCMGAASVSRTFQTSRRREVLSFEHHKVVAALDKRDQEWFLDRSESNGWSQATLREEVRRFKLDMLRRPGEGRYETQTIDDLNFLIKEGKQFGTIYADPPWPYGNQGTRAATHNHYKEHDSLSVEDICALPIVDLAADSAHCHLWTTNGFLREAFDVLDAWGFLYKSCFVWVKPDFGIGNYWRVGTEYLLLGIRGKCPFGDNSQQNWVYENAGKHSAKPAKVRRIIEKCSPGPRLELFGRREVEDWTVWGNEIERQTDNATLFAEHGPPISSTAYSPEEEIDGCD
jgi:N6-adenosine-specific RNA methylase IME4